LLTLFAQAGANLIEVEHVRDGVDLHVRETGVQVVLEIRGPEQESKIITTAQDAGYTVQKISGR